MYGSSLGSAGSAAVRIQRRGIEEQSAVPARAHFSRGCALHGIYAGGLDNCKDYLLSSSRRPWFAVVRTGLQTRNKIDAPPRRPWFCRQLGIRDAVSVADAPRERDGSASTVLTSCGLTKPVCRRRVTV